MMCSHYIWNVKWNNYTGNEIFEIVHNSLYYNCHKKCVLQYLNKITYIIFSVIFIGNFSFIRETVNVIICIFDLQTKHRFVAKLCKYWVCFRTLITKKRSTVIFKISLENKIIPLRYVLLRSPSQRVLIWSLISRFHYNTILEKSIN